MTAADRRRAEPPPASRWGNVCRRAVIVSVLVAWTAVGADRPEHGSKPSHDDPTTVYLGRGFAGRLDCPYSADPPATLVVWLRDGRVVDPDSRVRVSKAGSLLIRAAQVGDQGEYACAVYSPSGSTESSPVIRLLVRGKHAFGHCMGRCIHV